MWRTHSEGMTRGSSLVCAGLEFQHSLIKDLQDLFWCVGSTAAAATFAGKPPVDLLLVERLRVLALPGGLPQPMQQIALASASNWMTGMPFPAVAGTHPVVDCNARVY